MQQSFRNIALVSKILVLHIVYTASIGIKDPCREFASVFHFASVQTSLVFVIFTLAQCDFSIVIPNWLRVSYRF